MAAYAENSFKQKAVIEFLMKEGIAAREISDRLKKRLWGILTQLSEC